MMLSVRGLSKAFSGVRAVSDLSFDAPSRRVTAIIGPNGAGKSTAFNLITGAVALDSGRVKLGDLDVTHMTPCELARIGLARSFQITNLFFGLTVLENVRLACQARQPRSGYLQRLTAQHITQHEAREFLVDFGLQEREADPAGSLSHGEQRRLEIAICMAQRPKMLLLDEPTQGMSPAETRETATLISKLREHIGVLLVEHDMDMVMAVSDQIIVMHQGMKLAEGSRFEIAANKVVQRVYLGDELVPVPR